MWDDCDTILLVDNQIYNKIWHKKEGNKKLYTKMWHIQKTNTAVTKGKYYSETAFKHCWLGTFWITYRN